MHGNMDSVDVGVIDGRTTESLIACLLQLNDDVLHQVYERSKILER